MAAILQFQKRSITEKSLWEPGHTATILIYNGVRVERIDFDDLRNKADLALDSPARIAN